MGKIPVMVPHFSNYFTKGSFMFPEDGIAHDKKDENWYLSYAKAIMAEYYGNRCAISFQDVDEMRLMRQYGNGTQSPNIYKKRFEFKQTTQGKGPITNRMQAFDVGDGIKSFMNVQWDILPVASKFKSVVLGTLMKFGHEISIDAIDPKSGAEKQDMKLIALVEGIFKRYEQKISEIDGTTDVNPKLSQWTPNTIEEAELIASIGGFKLASELIMETCTQASLSVDSKWEDNIKMLILQDLMDSSKGMVKAYIDDFSGRVGHRYVDIVNAVYQWRRGSTDEARYAGEFVVKTVSDLRASGCFKEEEIRKLYNDARKEYVTGYYSQNDRALKEDAATMPDDFSFLCFECEFISDFIEYKTKRKTSKGDWAIFPADKDSEGKPILKNTDKRKSWEVNAEMLYGCTYILGCDKVYSHGLKDNIIREDDRVRLNYSMVSVPGESITKRSRPIYDQIQIDWLQYQNGRAHAAPPGIAIETGSISNVTLGGQIAEPLDILAVRRTTGDLMFKFTTHGTHNFGQQARPFEELKGGSGVVIQEFVDSMTMNLQLLREFNGLTEVASATDVNPRMGLGLSRMQLQSTENSLFPLLKSYETLLSTSCEKGYRLIQNVFLAHPIPEENPYYGNLSAMSIDVGKTIARTSRSKMGIRITSRPTDLEKETIMGMALESVKAGKNGAPGITPHDFFLIQRLVMTGNLKRAEIEIGMREAKSKADLEKAAMASSEQVAALDVQRKQAEAAMKLEQMEAEALIEVQKSTAIEQAKTAEERQRLQDEMEINLEKFKKFKEAGFIEFLVAEKV